MKPNLLLACTALAASLFALPSVHAQAGVYAAFTASRMGSIQSSPYAAGIVPVGGSVANDVRSTVDVSGGTFGGYYDFKTVGPIRLGADVRGNVERSSRGASAYDLGAGAHLYSVLGGVRGSFHTRYSFLSPYVQFSGGLGRSDYGFLRQPASAKQPLASELQSSLEYHVFAGADIHLFPAIDFRLVELGYGGLAPFGNNSHVYPLYSVGTGIVLHLPTGK